MMTRPCGSTRSCTSRTRLPSRHWSLCSIEHSSSIMLWFGSSPCVGDTSLILALSIGVIATGHLQFVCHLTARSLRRDGYLASGPRFLAFPAEQLRKVVGNLFRVAEEFCGRRSESANFCVRICAKCAFPHTGNRILAAVRQRAVNPMPIANGALTARYSDCNRWRKLLFWGGEGY